MLLRKPSSIDMERRPSNLQKLVVFALAFYSSLILARQTGSWRPEDPKSPKFMIFAWDSVAAINRVFNETTFSESYLIPAKVVSAKSQLVAGIHYKLDIEYSLSNCTKILPVKEVTKERCFLGYGNAGNNDWQIHTILVFEQPWRNHTSITVLH